jgi:hypothetical protein
MDFRTKATNHAFQLLALLPIPRFIHPNNKIRGVLENRLIHECLDFILRPLKQAAREGYMMSDPHGLNRYTFTHLAAYIADTPEAAALSGVAGKTSHLTLATYKQFGDSIRHSPRTASKTATDLRAIREVVEPSHLEAYIKEAMKYRLNGVHQPFWRDWALAEPANFFTPEPLHHWHKMFWDHDARWCINALGHAEIDFRFSVLHPHTGFRRFRGGISSLKQVTGREHRDIQRYIVAVVADGPCKDFITAIRALADFRYLAQASVISDELCDRIDAALSEFHAHKESIILCGARRGTKGVIYDWYIPKLEFLLSVTANIRENGVPIQWSADYTERCHITEIKDPSRASNNQGYESQICRYLDRAERCRQFDLATAIRKVQMSLPSNDPFPEDEPDDADDYNDDNVLDIVSSFSSSHTGRPRTNYFEHADELEKGMHPDAPRPFRSFVGGDTALHLCKEASIKMTIDRAMEKFNLPDLRHALVHFVSRPDDFSGPLIGGRRTSRVDEPLPFETLKIWERFQLQNCSYHPPHTVLPPQTVNASPPSGPWQFGHSDVVLVNTDAASIWPQSGLEGTSLILPYSH